MSPASHLLTLVLRVFSQRYRSRLEPPAGLLRNVPWVCDIAHVAFPYALGLSTGGSEKRNLVKQHLNKHSAEVSVHQESQQLSA